MPDGRTNPKPKAAMTQQFDVLAIGNAIVDVIAQADDDFLIAHSVRKGAMTLIDEDRAEKLYQAMGPTTVISGGSAANTAVGLASLGARAAFIGKVRDDTLGGSFSHDIRASKVHFATPPASAGPATARSFIMVSPDGQRTMNTYLGAAQNLAPGDIDGAAVQSAAIVYLEGYLWDPPAAKEAFVKAASLAHAASRRVALTLSDAFCVDRYREEFLNLIRTGVVDVLFANEAELHALYQTADFATAVEALRNEGSVLGIVTRSEQGAVVVSREATVVVSALPVDRVIDTTGAGDLFAAGFLAGLARGAEHRECARLGALAAAEIIQHFGARPQTDLAALAAQNGLAVS